MRSTALLAMLGLGGTARADDAPAVHALLAHPAELASWLAQRDPLVESQRAKVTAAAAAAQQARVLPNPTLSASVSDFVLGSSNPASPKLGLGDTLIYNVDITELIELGKREPRRTAADLREREAGEVATGALGDRVTNATAALGKLAYVAIKRGVVASNLEAANKLMALEKVRLDHKDLAPVDFARIELDTHAIALQLARAQADVSVAVASCSALLYATCTIAGLDDMTVLDSAAPLPPAMPGVDQAIENRPVRVASKLESDALNQDARLAHNRRIPDPTIGAGYTLDNLTISGDQHQTLMFSIGIPLPIFDRGDHDEAAARANARAIVAEDRAAVRDAHGQVEALLAQRTTLETTLRELETDAVPKSAHIIEQTRKAFDLGQAPLADLLLAERSHRDLLLEVLDTRFDLFNVRAQLRQQLGLDDEAARGAARSSR